MSKTKKWVCFLSALLLLSTGLFCAALADDDEEGEKKWYHSIFESSEERNKKRYLPPVDNPTYEGECGVCHFVYQPGLLPSGSWKKILAGLGDHNGESLELSPETKAIISAYLTTNAAEHSSAKRSVKIMKNLNGQTPLRITETPYIRKKHDDIDPDIFARESIGSRSNCPACHTKAKEGIYREKYVVIPE